MWRLRRTGRELPPWIVDYKSTSGPRRKSRSERSVDQVIGQEPAVEVIRKRPRQKRHVMLIATRAPGSRCSPAHDGDAPRDDSRIHRYQIRRIRNEPKIRVVPAEKAARS